VALTKEDTVVGYRETQIKNSHAEVVTVFIDDLIREHGFSFTDLKAVAVSKGPGSYTGLRIGVSVAKGFCYALNIPLIAVSTLRTLTVAALKKQVIPDDREVLFCPMIDARRMEVYSALFDSNLHQVRETKAEIIETGSFAQSLEKNTILFFGDGASKCREMIDHPNAIFYDAIFPSAQNMADAAFDAYRNKQFENVAYFEPYYLKDFIPGIPKVKGLI
jgi:tRNA threonylcarbamoyladenosine biosynthesis protein TsaB